INNKKLKYILISLLYYIILSHYNKMNNDLQSLRATQAKKYSEFKEKEDKEKNALEAKIKLENEEKILNDMLYREEFDNVLNKMESLTIDIQNSQNIVEIDFYLS